MLNSDQLASETEPASWLAYIVTICGIVESGPTIPPIIINRSIVVLSRLETFNNLTKYILALEAHEC